MVKNGNFWRSLATVIALAWAGWVAYKVDCIERRLTKIEVRLRVEAAQRAGGALFTRAVLRDALLVNPAVLEVCYKR